MKTTTIELNKQDADYLHEVLGRKMNIEMGHMNKSEWRCIERICERVKAAREELRKPVMELVPLIMTDSGIVLGSSGTHPFDNH